MATENKNYYDILGVAADAENRQIRKAFMRLANEYQSDRAKFPAADWYFERLKVAYDGLSDHEVRCRYNADRGLPEPPAPEDPDAITWLEGLAGLIPSNWYVYAFILVGVMYALARVIAWKSIADSGGSLP